MNIHESTRLTLLDRQETWRLYQTRCWKVAHLAERYRISRPTIYQILKRARLQEFIPRDSEREARRYNKSYPGELVHFDTKRLPLLKGQSPSQLREYLFVAIDDFSRELYAAILPDKTQISAARFSQTQPSLNALMRLTLSILIMAKSTKAPINMRLSKPASNMVSARNLPALIDLKPMVKLNVLFVPSWRVGITSIPSRHVELMRFINFYNTVKPHKGLNNSTPYEILSNYFYQSNCKQPE